MINILAVVSVGHIAQRSVLALGLPKHDLVDLMCKDQAHERVPQLMDGGADDGRAQDDTPSESSTHQEIDDNVTYAHHKAAKHRDAEREKQYFEKQCYVFHKSPFVGTNSRVVEGKVTTDSPARAFLEVI